MAAPVSSTADDTAYVTALVQADDLPRYYAALFTPPGIRDDLLAIFGFAAEIARVPDQVREPALGEIRLKWWSEALMRAIAGDGRGETPALRTASAAITRLALPIAPFAALVEARSADLYSDPPAMLSDLEGRLGETESVLFQMTAISLGAAGAETADAAGHAGVAYGIARRLAVLASDRARGRTIIPADILAAEQVAPPHVFAPSPPPGLHRAVAALAVIARRHAERAQARIAGLPAPLRPAFLPLAIVPPLLTKIERAGSALFARDVHLSNLESLVRIGWQRMRGASWRRGA